MIPECAFDPERLNFGIHVRLGDRVKANPDRHNEYFNKLKAFMDTVTKIVVEKGWDAPLFHVFSETLEPCPHPATGYFDEFPIWPVEMDQVRNIRVGW